MVVTVQPPYGEEIVFSPDSTNLTSIYKDTLKQIGAKIEKWVLDDNITHFQNDDDIKKCKKDLEIKSEAIISYQENFIFEIYTRYMWLDENHNDTDSFCFVVDAFYLTQTEIENFNNFIDFTLLEERREVYPG